MSVVYNFVRKVVLVTGSSSGIGAVTAQEFARAGAQVVITGRNANKLSEVGKQCLEVSPKRLEPLEVLADIGNENDCKRLVDQTIKKFGQLDVLVNNAGMGGLSSVFNPKIMDTFDELIKTNLRQVVLMTHLTAQYLEQTKGSIVNISSGAAIKPIALYGIYCTTKCALDMFTKCTALEMAPKGVRVNVINPAAVNTNFGVTSGLDEKTWKEALDKSNKDYPLGRIGQPIDVANAVLYLASDNCSWVTGINFVADGGLLLGPATKPLRKD